MMWRLDDTGEGATGPQTFDLTAGYGWDNEGRMTAMTYPEVRTAGTRYTCGFDAMGRTQFLNDTTLASGGQVVAEAFYGSMGELTRVNYFGMGEQRTYTIAPRIACRRRRPMQTASNPPPRSNTEAGSGTSPGASMSEAKVSPVPSPK